MPLSQPRSDCVSRSRDRAAEVFHVMRSHLAAATLILAFGLAPSLAQSPYPETPGATSDPLVAPEPKGAEPKTSERKAESAPAAKIEPTAKSETKAPGGKGGGKAAKTNAKIKNNAKSADKMAAEAQPIPPTPIGGDASTSGGRNVAATGRTMPPAAGRERTSNVATSTEAAMLKAQKAAEERNKAWDTKMRRTMSTICNGC